ncbi:hypothetical protein M011DRAFT_318724 [Sporormia fimetaria CBS 119925]|uniref:Uncharacterized protein n=1 Tax=Sporormia fimetaria CBS 119925 TaxID=1340428 RepID=A0A6A6UX96_9PLEO|nr:hypothetical protein M011DRAFT_318724 [Sporormia fimetaria CBS 119925]
MAAGQGVGAAANVAEDEEMEDVMDIDPETWQNAPHDPHPHLVQGFRVQRGSDSQHSGPPRKHVSDDDDEGDPSWTHTGEPEDIPPRGSKTMAWGRRGHSKFYINRKGPAATGYHRIESRPIFEEGETIDWLHNPPDELCVSNAENRIGEHKYGKTYRYTLKDFHGIYGVAFKAQMEKTFPGGNIQEGRAYELLNQARYEEWKHTTGRRPRFVPCYVRVGWKTGDGRIVSRGNFEVLYKFL